VARAAVAWDLLLLLLLLAALAAVAREAVGRD
jgi:hypothetical protein